MLEDFEFLVRLSEITDFTHINVVTCEYRYYLDGSNSMMFQRRKVFEALNVIYQKHPSRDKYIQDKRNTELEVVKKEVERIATLRKHYPVIFKRMRLFLLK